MLLNMDLKVRRDRELSKGIRPVADVADLGQLRAHGNAGPIVRERGVRLLYGRLPGVHDGRAQERPEARALFVGPVDEHDGGAGLEVLFLHRADDFEGAEDLDG